MIAKRPSAAVSAAAVGPTPRLRRAEAAGASVAARTAASTIARTGPDSAMVRPMASARRPIPTRRRQLQFASRSSQPGTTGPEDVIAGSRGWNAARADPVTCCRNAATGTATIIPMMPAAIAPIGRASRATAGWTRKGAGPPARRRTKVIATSMATAAARTTQRGPRPLASEGDEHDEEVRDEGAQVRDHPAHEEDRRERSRERRPEHQHHREHRGGANDRDGGERPEEAADAQRGIATAEAEGVAILGVDALQRPCCAAVRVEEDEERQEGGEDRDRRGQRDPSGELAGLVLHERRDDGRDPVQRRGGLRGERRPAQVRLQRVDACLEAPEEVDGRRDDRDDRERDPGEDDDADRRPGNERRPGVGPAPLTQTDDDGRGRGREDRREDERRGDGDEEERDPHEDERQPHDREDPPAEGGEVLEPDRHEARIPSGRRGAIAEAHVALGSRRDSSATDPAAARSIMRSGGLRPSRPVIRLTSRFRPCARGWSSTPLHARNPPDASLPASDASAGRARFTCP